MTKLFKTADMLSSTKDKAHNVEIISGPNEVFTSYLMQGNLLMPQKLYNNDVPELVQFWKALWHNFLLKENSTTSTIYWHNRIDNSKAFTKFIIQASKLGWIEVSTSSNSHWSDVKLLSTKLLKLISQQQLTEIRLNFKLLKYSMISVDKSDNIGDKTRLYSGVKDTGIIRSGFALSGNTPFTYDTKYLVKYHDAIIANVTKSMTKMSEKFDDLDMEYADIATQIVNDFIHLPSTYYTGSNTNDSRGRAIAECTSKIGNPITFKDFRALMSFSEPIEFERRSLKYVYAFIAELLGIKAKTQIRKEAAGFKAYNKRTLPILDLTKEHDRKDLHELIWIERLYDELDRFFEHEKSSKATFYFNVPGEFDFTASMLAIEGALLDSKPFLELTNCISVNGELSDIWSKLVDSDISRNMMKKAATPSLYGSGKTAAALWIKNNIEFNPAQVIAYQAEVRTGDLAIANKFKEAIINNVEPQEHMTVKIWNETLDIECNRFKYQDHKPVAKHYNMYDSKSGELRQVTHVTPSKVPDLDQFKRYFVTLLIHNLDSQVANQVCIENDTTISIHDAFICNFGSAHNVKSSATRVVTAIHRDRTQIITDFCDSIGIDPSLILDIETISAGDFECSINALK